MKTFNTSFIFLRSHELRALTQKIFGKANPCYKIIKFANKNKFSRTFLDGKNSEKIETLSKSEKQTMKTGTESPYEIKEKFIIFLSSAKFKMLNILKEDIFINNSRNGTK